MRGLQRGDRGDHRGGPPGLDAAIGVLRLLAHDRHALADLQRAVADPAHRHAADVVVGGEVRDEQLERVIGLVGRRRGDLDEEVEQRAEVGRRQCQVAGGGAGLGVRVHDREVDLVVIGAEVDEQVVHRVEDFLRAGVGPVDLVDRHDHREVAGHRLLEDVAGLGKGALGRVHQQQHGVDQEQ